jgi:hypothetical protein
VGRNCTKGDIFIVQIFQLEKCVMLGRLPYWKIFDKSFSFSLSKIRTMITTLCERVLFSMSTIIVYKLVKEWTVFGIMFPFSLPLHRTFTLKTMIIICTEEANLLLLFQFSDWVKRRGIKHINSNTLSWLMRALKYYHGSILLYFKGNLE